MLTHDYRYRTAECDRTGCRKSLQNAYRGGRRILPVSGGNALFGYLVVWETGRKMQSVEYLALEIAASSLALERFRTWIGGDCIFLTWGFDDIRVLEDNILLHAGEPDWITKWYNAQMVFNAQTGTGSAQKSLSSAMEILGIEPSRPAHDALGDAYHTALICSRLRLAEGIEAYGQAAKEHENGSFGKTECWYIMDAPENATLVIGHNAKTKEELASMIHEGRWSEFIREIPVKKGDFIQIDPGTVHAIKGGLLILETQQNSDITYRVYDYDRLQNGRPRELHIEKSIDVITVPAKSVEDSVTSATGLPENQLNELYACGYYQIYKLDVNGTCSFAQNYPFLLMSVLEGSGIVNGQPVKKGDHFILPCGFGEVEMQGEMSLVVSTVPAQA